MSTLNQFIYYKNFAISVFNYFNGRINKNILCSLEIDYIDNVNNTLGNLKRPNIVYIHINNIIDQCGNANNRNAVSSLIIEVIAHELFHVEQLISQEKYRNNNLYANNIEMQTSYAAYNFLIENMSEINSIFNILLDLSYLKEELEFYYLKESCYKDSFEDIYSNSNTESLYYYTIMNVIFRNDSKFYKFKAEELDRFNNVIIEFENIYNCLIKSNGVYNNQALRGFISNVSAIFGIFDCYTLSVVSRIESNRGIETNIIKFSISDGVVCPYYKNK